VIGFFLKADKTQVLSAAAVAIVLIALADWAVGTRASLGLLYLIPMMMGATVLAPWQTALLAIACSALRAFYDLPHPQTLELLLRFLFAFLAYTGLGLFVTALIRNRELAVQHLADVRREQSLRREAEEQLKLLAESSPAAILTIDAQGVVLAANKAAETLFSIAPDQSLRGRGIGTYLPVLADALQYQSGLQGLRTAAQCQGRRENGELFLAHTWFSSYTAADGPRLAAIVVDSSEEMRDREEQGLQQLMKGNRIAAAAVSHEVRNLCSAISLICANLTDKHRLAADEDLQALINLVGGLERIASLDLHGRAPDVEPVALQEVLDDLRIVIEPDWREINGRITWDLLLPMPIVVAERHGLLQAFLNLAQNSHRAVQDRPVRELTISVTVDQQATRIRFRDSGPGIISPEHLFEPFQPGSDGTGLGLYVSRAVVRSYGGELRYEPQPGGSCFTVEVQTA
jgi:two-component system sensor kinase FixL